MSQLIADCLYYILEYLENDKVTLYSCLIVNRLWCEVAVRILWRNGLKYKPKTIITLIACLPKKSIEILHDNGIIPTPTSNPPMFNYAAFCKNLSIDIIQYNVKWLLKRTKKTEDKVRILLQEILKLFMSQISSLKYLYFM